MKRGIIVEIDLKAASHNLSIAKKLAPSGRVFAVVKADAYGHGAVEVSSAFEKAGASALAVAFVSEARRLREAGIKLPIIVLFDNTELPLFFEMNLTPVIHDFKTAAHFSREAAKRHTTIGVHLKVDTGMGRLGLNSAEEALKTASLPDIKILGLMSHFSDADSGDKDFMRHQIGRFKEIRDALQRKKLRPLCHMANSAALFSLKESLFDAVRPGLMLYGCSPFAGPIGGLPVRNLKPVMKAKAKVLSVRRLDKGHPISYGKTFIAKRKTLSAIVSAGYADGYPRACSNNSFVEIKGKLLPVMGRVCMDLLMVDATETEDVKPGDDALLLGGGIPAWRLAKASSSIPYEIFTSLGRNPRAFVA